MFKGYVVNEEGKRLEKKNNWCNRQCKYKFKGKDLPQTIPVRCKCEGTDCSYQFKMKGVFKKWRTWGDKDDQGNFFVDQNGVPSKQLECGIVHGVWAEWSDFSCQGSYPKKNDYKWHYTNHYSLMKRTRKCLDSKDKSVELSSDQCIGESEELGEKCLKGCNVQPRQNTVGEQNWRQAGYHIRCQDSEGYKEWYVFKRNL